MTPVARPCHILFGQCSKDRVTVYHGNARATVLCGRHAAYLRPEDFKTMREAGAIE
jgi:hypothetical protein